MSESPDFWVERLKDLSREPSEEQAKAFVDELYSAAQEDLDTQRAQAEYEREE